MADKPYFQIPGFCMPTIDPIEFTAFRLPKTLMQDHVRDLNQAMAGLRRSLKEITFKIPNDLASALKGWAEAIEGTVKDRAAKDALKVRGILPHKSTPWHQFDPTKPDEFADAVLSYYSTEWTNVRTVFMSDLDAYNISEEAKCAFVEGLECHTSKLYRPAILTVLSTAEAEFRRAFEITPGSPAASLVELRQAIMDAPVGVMLSHVAPFDLFNMLDMHLYERINTLEDFKKFAVDPIPNRHAAIHGIIHYKTELCSLNALILTDYVFFLISQLTDYSRD